MQLFVGGRGAINLLSESTCLLEKVELSCYVLFRPLALFLINGRAKFCSHFSCQSYNKIGRYLSRLSVMA